MNPKFTILRELIVQFSNSYFNLYHNITLEYEVGRLDQISNFNHTVLYSLKRIGDEDLFEDEDTLAAADLKLARLINELVLLQYKTTIDRKLLILFLEDANALRAFLGSTEQKKTLS